ncbi:Aspercryptin biosynthesis cluster protein B [Colletotrichum sp. SAR11_240]|nr:Aspercryptin biosynthesis cluster protein B [Colletotrichum sp. SAR11_240]
MSQQSLCRVSVPEGKYEFLCIIPDKPGTREKRIEVRSQHFANAMPLMESGVWKTGGALLDSVPKSDNSDDMSFVGSHVVVVGDSIEQVRDDLKKDVYATSGVWDIDNAQIYAFRAAWRNP